MLINGFYGFGRFGLTDSAGNPVSIEQAMTAIRGGTATYVVPTNPSVGPVFTAVVPVDPSTGIPSNGHLYTGGDGGGLLPNVIANASASSKTLMLLAGAGVIGAAVWLGSKRMGKSAAMAGYSRRKYRRSRGHR